MRNNRSLELIERAEARIIERLWNQATS